MRYGRNAECGIAFTGCTLSEKGDMVLQGRVEKGAVVFPERLSLPDGTEVTVIVPTYAGLPERATDHEHRVKLPLIASAHPGSRGLTGDRVAELLDEDDLSS